MQELRAENRRLNREMNGILKPDRRLMFDVLNNGRDKRLSGATVDDLHLRSGGTYSPLPTDGYTVSSQPTWSPSQASDALYELRDRLMALEAKLAPPSLSAVSASPRTNGVMESPIPVRRQPSQPKEKDILREELNQLKEKMETLSKCVEQLYVHLSLPIPSALKEDTTSMGHGVSDGYSTPLPATATRENNIQLNNANETDENRKSSDWRDVEQAMKHHVETFSSMLSSFASAYSRRTPPPPSSSAPPESDNHSKPSGVSAGGGRYSGDAIDVSKILDSIKKIKEELGSVPLTSSADLSKSYQAFIQLIREVEEISNSPPRFTDYDSDAEARMRNDRRESASSCLSDVDWEGVSHTWREVSPYASPPDSAKDALSMPLQS